jgi:hypothetical protein
MPAMTPKITRRLRLRLAGLEPARTAGAAHTAKQKTSNDRIKKVLDVKCIFAVRGHLLRGRVVHESMEIVAAIGLTNEPQTWVDTLTHSLHLRHQVANCLQLVLSVFMLRKCVNYHDHVQRAQHLAYARIPRAAQMSLTAVLLYPSLGPLWLVEEAETAIS